MKTRTFMGYDKEGKQVRGYILDRYNFDELKKYMTLAEFDTIDYIQELKWDDKTTRNEDGSFKDIRDWKYADTVKHYIHR